MVPYFVLMPKEKLSTEKQHLWQKKQTGCNNNVINQDKRKKVMFDEDMTTYIYDEEMKKNR